MFNYSSSTVTILTNSDTKSPEKTSKQKYEEKEKIREAELTEYFSKISKQYKVGDMLHISYHQNEYCGVLYKDIYTKREYGELYIKIQIAQIDYYVSGAHINNSIRTYELFNVDDYNIRLATNDDIERCVRNYLKEEITDKRDEILEAKKEIKRLKTINSNFSKDCIEDVVQNIINSFNKS